MKKVKEGRGITLIALVITIIVLLILAGISISMLSGENSILSRAQEARDKTIESQNEEQTKLAQGSAALNLKGTVTSEGIKIPAGFAVSEKEEENSVEDGLVMVDSNGNEYVWIEVPNANLGGNITFGPDYSAQGLTATEITGDLTNEQKGKIEEALWAYTYSSSLITKIESSSNTTVERKTTTCGWKDEWYDGCGLEQEEYNTLYKNMLKSIYNNGGFWIGRYEAGIEGSDKDISLARQSYTSISEGPKAVSKPDHIPYNWIKCDEAETLAKRAGGNLMFGIQWDLTLRYLQAKGAATQSELVSDSKDWGNYKLEYYLNQNAVHGYKATFSENDYKLEWSTIESGYIHNGMALSTGATERNKKQNIYDLAGNMYEWTLEHSTYVKDNASCDCAGRGGIFYDTGLNIPVSTRISNSTLGSHCYIGFRVSLY